MPVRTNPATAITAGLLALAVAAFQIVLVVDLFDQLPKGIGIGDLPSQLLTPVIIQAVAALFLLVGSLLVFLRKVAGGILVMVGAVVALAGFFLEPVIKEADFGTFFEAVFGFEAAGATFRALSLIVAPIALVLAVIPPTMNHLRAQSAAGYQQYPGSGGFPQQHQGW